MTKTEDELRAIINEVNRKALLDELRPHEVAEVRELLPQVKEMLEEKRRRTWLFSVMKSIAIFLVGIPASVLALIEVIRTALSRLK